MITERSAQYISGFKAVFMFLAIGGVLAVVFWLATVEVIEWLLAVISFLGAAMFFCFKGFIIINPNQAAVVQLFGTYIGSVKQDGFCWINPFATRKMVSLRIHNFETTKLKVNDHDGNPIEIAAVVVWNVVETAEAAFNVEDYKDFVHVQSEAAVRNLATSFPYDAHEEGKQSLRANTNEIATELKKEIQDRLSKAGITVIEARISHLAYAPEIASAMLRRQQANAIIAARQRIVEGAVSMVQMALQQLEEHKVVKLDDERKAAMVSNLLVVLTSDRDAQPVVNTGTLYQ